MFYKEGLIGIQLGLNISQLKTDHFITNSSNLDNKLFDQATVHNKLKCRNRKQTQKAFNLKKKKKKSHTNLKISSWKHNIMMICDYYNK